MVYPMGRHLGWLEWPASPDINLRGDIVGYSPALLFHLNAVLWKRQQLSLRYVSLDREWNPVGNASVGIVMTISQDNS
jgi:hypothetical protein